MIEPRLKITHKMLFYRCWERMCKSSGKTQIGEICWERAEKSMAYIDKRKTLMKRLMK